MSDEDHFSGHEFLKALADFKNSNGEGKAIRSSAGGLDYIELKLYITPPIIKGKSMSIIMVRGSKQDQDVGRRHNGSSCLTKSTDILNGLDEINE